MNFENTLKEPLVSPINDDENFGIVGDISQFYPPPVSNPQIKRIPNIDDNKTAVDNFFNSCDAESRINYVFFMHQNRMQKSFFLQFQELVRRLTGKEFPFAKIGNNAVFRLKMGWNGKNIFIQFNLASDGSQSANKSGIGLKHKLGNALGLTHKTPNNYFSKSEDNAKRHLEEAESRGQNPKYGYQVLGDGVYLLDTNYLFFDLYHIQANMVKPNVEYNLILVRHGKAEHNIKPMALKWKSQNVPRPLLFHYTKNTSLLEGSDEEINQSAMEFVQSCGDINQIHAVGVSDLKRTQETAGYFLGGLEPKQIRELEKVFVVPCMHELAPKGENGQTDLEEEKAKLSRLTGRWMHKENESTCRDFYDFDLNRKKLLKKNVTLCDRISLSGRSQWTLPLLWKYYLKYYNVSYDDTNPANRKYREDSYGTSKCSQTNFLGEFFRIMNTETPNPTPMWAAKWKGSIDDEDDDNESDYDGEEQQQLNGGENEPDARGGGHLRRHKRTCRKRNRIGRRKSRRNNKIKTKRKTKR
jgi:broad specificity phosphatase PhoE